MNDIKLDDFDNKELPFSLDPDRPRAVLKQGSTKHERVPRSGIEHVQSSCVRRMTADYNGDKSDLCMFLSLQLLLLPYLQVIQV